MNKKEKARIERKTELILNALRAAGDNGITNAELSQIALRYGGHLGELYRDGYKIDRVSLGNGLHNYTLVAEPYDIIIRKKAIDILFLEVGKAGFVDKEALKEIMEKNSISVKYKANTYK